MLFVFQDFNAFSDYMRQFPGDEFLTGVSDFHLLIYMATCDMLPLKVKANIYVSNTTYQGEN